jgi:DNA-binding transcriptional LysR family regulator
MSRFDHLKLSHLRLLARLAETGQIGRAAAALGMTQPAASRMLAEIAGLVGHPVHARQGRGMVLTGVGQALARRAARVLEELDAARAEASGIAAGGAGHVRLGAVTAPALDLVLPVLRALRLTDPGLTFEVSVAPSAQLCADLRAGRLDLAVGRLATPEEAADLVFEPVGTEPVALVVRRGHPLDRGDGAPPVLSDLLAHDWVLPGASSPMTAAVQRRLAEMGARLRAPPLTTASQMLTLVMVAQTNAIAPLAEAVARAFTAGPRAAYVRLAAPFAVDVGPYGLLLPRGAVPSPAVARLAALLRAEGSRNPPAAPSAALSGAPPPPGGEG